MKPSFALNLSQEGIGLLHRAKGGWNHAGEVGFDAPDLALALGTLRETAVALAGEKLLTKLILPNDQILYFETPVTKGNRAEQIEAALDGRTPYGLEELAYDFKVSNGVAQVAAVARETLAEAEGFATEHGFNPVSFVAIPDQALFKGEAWFGPSALSASLLPEGQQIDRDRNAVKVIGQVELPAPAPTKEATPKPTVDAAPPDNPDTPDTAQPQLDLEPPAPPVRPEQMSPLPPPEDRPSFSTSRDTQAKPSKPAQAPVAQARLTLSAQPDQPQPGPVSVLSDSTPEPKPSARVAAETAKPKATLGAPAPKAEAKPEPKQKPRKRPSLPKVPKPKLSAPKIPKPKIAAPKLPKPKLPALRQRGTSDQGTQALTPSPTEQIPAPKPKVTAVASSATQTSSASEAEALTVFGARKAQKQSNAPMYLGVGLTVALVLVMAAVAMWSALFMTQDVALLPEPDAATSPVIAPVDPQAAPVTPEVETPIDTAAQGPQAPVLPEQDTLDTLYVASIDPQIPGEDAVALPPADSLLSDTATALTPQLPPIPGQIFELDERGLVAPSTEGTLSPEGPRVFSGQPPLVPPPRPQTDAALAQPEPTPDPQADALRARVAEFRPRARPANLDERQERAETGGFSREELAQIKPRPRPERTVTAPVEPDTQTPDATVGLASSIKPQSRPAGFEKTVARAQENAKATPIAAVPAASRTAPSIPTSASVAKQATFTNGINLRDLNLIGVYGASNDRRALVRLSSGRFKKVEVGDRLDGGRVASIGDDNLTYVKGGRNYTLDMPDG